MPGREWIEKNKAVVIPAIGVVVLASLALGFYATGETNGAVSADKPGENRIFFTTDNGATYFEVKQLPASPPDRDGKASVRAHVGKQSDGKSKVFYLERPKAGGGIEYKAAGAADKWQTFKDELSHMGWMSSFRGPDGKIPEYLGP